VKNPVTPKDADKFEAYMLEWQDKLNLKDWRIVRSSKRASGAMAKVMKRHVEDRLASYRIGVDFGSEEVSNHTLESTAVHELLHILLAELLEVAEAPGHTQEQLMSAEHRVVNTIEKLLVQEPSKN
jgi:hypothetical protein